MSSVVAALYVVISVLLGRGNSLAHLCYYLLIGGVVLGLLAPRPAFFAWILACGYSDLLKRLMIAFGEVHKKDLYNVLGVAPSCFGAIVLSITFGGLTGSYTIRMKQWVLLLGGIIWALATGVIYAREAGSLADGIQGIANGGLYSLMLFTVPILFPRNEDVMRVLRFCLWAYLPVALYGIAQRAFGFQKFEVDYLRTGLSIEMKQLFTGGVRAFSTLNSPTALGAISAIMIVVTWSLANIRLPAPYKVKTWLGRSVTLFMLLCYAGSLVASTARSDVVIIGVGIVSMWCFLDHQRTRGFYFLGISSFVILVFVSPFLLDHLEQLMAWMGSGTDANSLAGQLTMVGSYSDRLYGFAHVLRNPAVWSPFGRWDGNWDTLPEHLYHHDIVSMLLLRFGVVPLGCVLFLMAIFLVKLHRKLLMLDDMRAKRLVAMSLGISSALVLMSALSGSVLSVFPVNSFFWMFLSIAILGVRPQTAPPAAVPVRSTGLDLYSLAGRTPGCRRFGQRRPATT